MLIFGSVGIFVNYIPMPSSVIAFVRGLVGMLFLCLVIAIGKKGFSFKNIKQNLLLLLFSGAALGFNWILLFEAFNFTSVATATLTYYLAPFFVIIVSPFLLKEKLNKLKLLCILPALLGMVFVSGVIKTGIPEIREIKGILLALGAAVLYAAVMILNKKTGEISPYEKTVSQLSVSAIVVLPYILLTENISELKLDSRTVILLLVVGVVHTGIAYALYFGSIKLLKAQTTAVLSFIDPAAAVLFSAVILKEQTDVYGIIGAVLILGSAFACEWVGTKVGKQS